MCPEVYCHAPASGFDSEPGCPVFGYLCINPDVVKSPVIWQVWLSGKS